MFNTEKIGYNNVKELEEKIIIFQQGLKKKYGKYVDEKIFDRYLPPEESVIVNDDPDLYPVELKIPEPPELHKIDGFGLPAEEQFFRRQIMPTKLADLIKMSKDYTDVVEKIEKNKRTYKDVILWIQKQWNHRLYGYWFWNLGVPTYIDGWHFFYLNYFHLDEGLPKFVYRDRIFFLFTRYCFTTHEAPFFYRVLNPNLGENEFWYFSTKEEGLKYIHNNDLKEKDLESGTWMIEYPNRTCYGFNYPKHRREGATYKGAAINIEIITRTRSARGLVQSMDGDAAKQTFKEKYLDVLRKMEFFFMPNITTSLSNKDVVSFDTSAVGTRKKEIVTVESLMSDIHPQPSSSELKEDGNKYIFIHGDETGKGNVNRPYSCLKRHDVMLKTVAQRPVIHGMIVNTSTSDDTKAQFGRNYQELCKKSMWHRRNHITGLTESGLVNLFIPCDINLSTGYTDMYGLPLIEKLTKEQQKQTGEKYGAREFIESILEQKSGDSRAYYHELREFPLRYRHCFMTSTEESSFDMLELNNIISKIDMMLKPPVRVGDFEWTDGWGSSVKFVDKATGKFQLSYTPARTNYLIRNEEGKLVGGNKDLFVASCDPFRYDKTKGRKNSKGGGAVYFKRDYSLDPESKTLEDWVSDRFVCTYSNETTTDTFNEDMLMMTIYFGCEMFPEMNEEHTYRYFKNNKYRYLLGYLYIDGKKAEKPGFYTHASRIKPMIFKLWKWKIERNIRHEKHRDILQECTDIQGLDEMTRFDLFTGGGGCLLAVYYDKQGAANYAEDQEENKGGGSILEHILNMQGVLMEDTM